MCGLRELPFLYVCWYSALLLSLCRSRDALVFCSGLQRGTREFELAARAPALGSCVDPVCLRLVITVPLNFGRIG